MQLDCEGKKLVVELQVNTVFFGKAALIC